MKLKAIVAMAQNGIIGFNNGIPWPRNATDMRWFSQTTKSEGATLIMGRKTWESLPNKRLPGRQIYVLTHSTLGSEEPTVTFVNSVSDIPTTSETLWVCGGAQVYEQLLPLCDDLYLTTIDDTATVVGDVTMPPFPKLMRLIDIDVKDTCQVLHYAKE